MAYGCEDSAWNKNENFNFIPTQVELSMAYGCEDQMSRQTLLRYIHQNRNHNSLKINTMGTIILFSLSLMYKGELMDKV